ncbi:MAG TPA: choice-of-anchor tandem repeat GloVer-containing protein [Chthoniobacterales bacterium]|jgi:uncharacterized repeat protein (TIGR03803 family)|nr:choice-of-anchor tandem repeat GloVer-containing protein [Chthoniobacterales bacterium]
MKATRYLTLIATAAILSCFALNASGTSSRVIHAFNGADGDEPTWLLETSDGTLWGVTFLGGGGGLGNGVLYKIDRRGTFSVVHTFTDSPDGSLPGKLIQASDRTIYGLTAGGGANFAGTVYKVTTAGAYSIVHSFNSTTEGSGPNHLFQSNDGFFYGTTSSGGIPDPACPNHEPQGTLFRMDPAGNVTALHTFCEDSDGSVPDSVVEATDGFLYGTCKQDGPGLSAGTFWKSDKAGNVTLLHTFGPKTLNGDQPTEPNGIVQAGDGLFYGVANSGGLASNGAIFRADPAGNVTTIHSLSALVTDGSDPESNFFLASDGFFYGTTSHGGLPFNDFNKAGIVYRTDTAGRLWVLHTFIGDDGSNPVAAPVLDPRGRSAFATAIFQGPSNHGTTINLNLRQNLPISDLTFSPNPVKGGQASTATITLSRPAGSSGQVITLDGSGPATVPATITVPSGQVTATFIVNTQTVSQSITAGVTASIGSIGISASLTLTP